MRTLKSVSYDKLVGGQWYSCLMRDPNEDLSYCEWYFRFVGYDGKGDILNDKCYSTYHDGGLYSSSGRVVNALCDKSDIKPNSIRGVSEKWVMDKVKEIGGL